MGAPEFVEEHRVEVLVLGASAANTDAPNPSSSAVSGQEEGVDVRAVVRELKKVRCKVFSSDWPYCLYGQLQQRRLRMRLGRSGPSFQSIQTIE